ncbi:glycosyltransferase [Vibrio europaeus]|uniref:Glycosyl transferase n=1 Tax=Vibrio europaeus TaxID=300876 RepID=A0A178JAP9_9VIBR|nr:glycosyltransferase [Vibrio europaeus]MDC5703120.1 glycosyltransferase [Vibrio europaeus]MDC5708648.1 glycosyltransferase [Vibrio europaeus]MDC5713012.1 glycosyltransferase [Vibrio europaeus]MDC5718025.1 glycosyltransferase [Vibrio europaeus]MDC5725432.1 glycosyltransferase [Vibrio europaeus]
MNTFPIMVANRTIKLIGNIFKVLAYPFHFVLPKTRFSIPEHSPARVRTANTSNVTKIIWQTNYSNRSTLPVYLNYLFNRLMSLDYEYRYVSTEGREEYLREHAPKEVYEAYLKLTDGAAQADLWRVTTLYLQGGVYMDIDATLVWPLKRILKGVSKSLYIKIKDDTEITNYFLATCPNNPEYKAVMEAIVHNVENYDPAKGVYGTTGPQVFNDVLNTQEVNSRRRRYVCIQGTFTNEYFQYLDKPRGKWTHQDPNDLIKK